MDIKLPHSLLKDFLKTRARPNTIADKLSLCGPTVDQVVKTDEDWLYHIEVITNRIDSANAFGIAREASVILPQFDLDVELINDPYKNSLSDLGELPKNKPVQVQIMDSSLVPRFTAITLKDINVQQSPKELKKQLKLSGQRPINNIIDISNELTLKYGQPVHIFDLDKISDNQMIIRTSKKGETITTLDGQSIKLRGDDIVIEDGKGKLIDLCGIMGSKSSRVDQDTNNILLFVQNYDPQRIRRTSLYTQHRTLAAQIFEKQPDPELVMPVLIEGVKLLQKRAEAQISSSVLDIYPNPPEEQEVKIDLQWLNSFVGQKLEKAKVKEILTSLGFKVSGDKTLICKIPSWRHHDINIKQDLAEEITRIHGYFSLPSKLPKTKPYTQPTDKILKHEYKAKQVLTHLGFTEIYNTSLVSEDLFDKCNLKLKTDFKLKNPLSKEHQYMRTSLIPSILSNLSDNVGSTNSPLRIFELANIYLPQQDKDLADERPTLVVATQGLDFFFVKSYLESLSKYLKIDFTYLSLKEQSPPFVKKQTAQIKSKDQVLGNLGVINPQVASKFDIKDKVIIAQLDFQSISDSIDPLHKFKPVPETSVVIEDMTIESDMPAGKILKKLLSNDLIYKAQYITEYKGKHTFKLYFNNPEKNITQKQVNKVKEKIKDSL